MFSTIFTLVLRCLVMAAIIILMGVAGFVGYLLMELVLYPLFRILRLENNSFKEYLKERADFWGYAPNGRVRAALKSIAQRIKRSQKKDDRPTFPWSIKRNKK